MMQTIERIGGRDHFIEVRPTPKDVNVVVSANIRADVRRIVYALSIPEYMEAWMVVPAADRVTCVGEDRSEVNFRLDLCRSGRVHASIHCRRLLATPEHLKFAWHGSGGEGKGQSIVDIRIKQCKTKCIVSIQHKGSGIMLDTTWHSALWRGSLDKLGRLLEA